MTIRVNKTTADLLVLRAVVAALGERSDPPWWKTQFLTKVGLRNMERLLPRTAAGGALRSVIRAAQMDHDRKVGVGRHYHLFRFPMHLENALDAMLEDPEQLGGLQELLVSEDHLLRSRLDELSGDPITAGEGPINLGIVSRIGNPTSVGKLAAIYRLALLDGVRRFPYFEEGTRS
jgi:hypothetical protein